MTMICGNCSQTGIRWVGPFSNLTHTECPYCGGTNCQLVDQPEPDELETATCGCGAQQERLNAIRRQEEAVEQARLDEVARANAAADEILRQQQARQADERTSRKSWAKPSRR